MLGDGQSDTLSMADMRAIWLIALDKCDGNRERARRLVECYMAGWNRMMPRKENKPCGSNETGS